MSDNADIVPDGQGIDGDLFKVLANSKGQHSLWPAKKEIPEGWDCVFAPASRNACLDFVEANWTDKNY